MYERATRMLHNVNFRLRHTNSRDMLRRDWLKQTKIVRRVSAHTQNGDLTTVQNTNGICSTYNAILDIAQPRQECEEVALTHDDVYIYDRTFGGCQGR
jgi:hypothetical protein